MSLALIAMTGDGLATVILAGIVAVLALVVLGLISVDRDLLGRKRK